MSNTQSNTRVGDVVFPAYSDLTGLANRLVKLVNNSGVPQIAPLASKNDSGRYLLITEGTAGQEVTVRPLEEGRTMRITFKGTGNPGDIVAAADPGTAADAGKVRSSTNPTDGPTCGILEEAAVDGQFARIRPLIGGRPRHFVSGVLVAGTVTIADTTVTANSLIDPSAQVKGGTEGILSVGTVTPGTGFVINSTSNTDTSTVVCEVVN
jgi:hypothetical protein